MNKKRIFSSLLLFLLSIGIVFLLVPSFKSDAAVFQGLYVYMSRMKAGLDGTAGNQIEYVVGLTPTQTIPAGGTLKIYFPDTGSGNWCRTAGALTVAGASTSPVDLSGYWDITTALAGTLSASCAKGTGTGAGTPDTLTVTGVGALTAGTTYGVKISNNTGILGTANDTTNTLMYLVEMQSGSVIDSGAFKFKLLAEDQVTITATVQEAPSITCTISPTSVDLGVLYPGGSYATGTNSITAETSASASGYYWAVYGKGNGTNSGLYKSTATVYLLPSTSPTVNLAAMGAEGFGLTASTPTPANSGTVSADFVDTTIGRFGGLGASGTPGAKLLIQKNSAQTAQSSSTITYGARAGNTAQPGAYTETVTFVCGGYY